MIKSYKCSGIPDVIDAALLQINKVGVESNTHLCPICTREKKYLQVRLENQHSHISKNTISKF